MSDQLNPGTTTMNYRALKSFSAVSCLFLVLASPFLSGCGKKAQQPEVSFSSLEDARAQSRANALYNAQAYRAENPRFSTHKIVAHSDSTQSNDCPQGDGWATVTIMAVNDKEIDRYSVKCSTVSTALGCYLEKDFIEKPFAREEGHCQPTSKVPYPLPKLGM